MFRPFPADRHATCCAARRPSRCSSAWISRWPSTTPAAGDPRGHGPRRSRTGSAPTGEAPYPAFEPVAAEEVPDFYSGCFGLGSRDLQPGDIVAAVDNMLPMAGSRASSTWASTSSAPDTRLPKLQIWQDQLLEGYPHLGRAGAAARREIDLMPEGSTSHPHPLRRRLGRHHHGQEPRGHDLRAAGLLREGQPEVRLGEEGPADHVLRHARAGADPAQLRAASTSTSCSRRIPTSSATRTPWRASRKGGVFVIQSDLRPRSSGPALPGRQRDIREKGHRGLHLDAFKIASDEATDPGLRYRMQGAAFMGAFFHVAPHGEARELDEEQLFEGIRKQLRRSSGTSASARGGGQPAGHPPRLRRGARS